MHGLSLLNPQPKKQLYSQIQLPLKQTIQPYFSPIDGSHCAHTDKDESWMAVAAKGSLCPQVRPQRLAQFPKMSGTGGKSREVALVN